MKLTTKGRFAVTALLDLALCDYGALPVNLAMVAQRQAISLSYLEQLFGKLRRAGLVKSVRGPGGGYVLARPMAQVSVADIVVAVDEPMDARQCEGRENCKAGKTCITHHLWSDLNDKMLEYLSSISVADLVRDHHARAQEECTSTHNTRGATHPLVHSASMR